MSQLNLSIFKGEENIGQLQSVAIGAWIPNEKKVSTEVISHMPLGSIINILVGVYLMCNVSLNDIEAHVVLGPYSQNVLSSGS